MRLRRCPILQIRKLRLGGGGDLQTPLRHALATEPESSLSHVMWGLLEFGLPGFAPSPLKGWGYLQSRLQSPARMCTVGALEVTLEQCWSCR